MIDSRRPSRKSESDTNLTAAAARLAGAGARPGQPRTLLAEDERYFLRQSVSTPCLNAIVKAEGIWIEDTAGRRYMDFHGNNVHHIGYGHPRLKRAIAEQMDALPFAPRRYTCEPAVALARKARRDRAGQPVQGAVHHRRLGRDRGGGQDRARRDRPLQDAVVLGCVPWRRLRRAAAVGRGAVPLRRRRRRWCRAPSMSRRSPAIAAPTATRASQRKPTSSDADACARMIEYVLGTRGRRRGASSPSRSAPCPTCRRPASGGACATPATGTARC